MRLPRTLALVSLGLLAITVLGGIEPGSVTHRMTPPPVGARVWMQARTVYDWSEARCDRRHVPDAPLRAIRLAPGDTGVRLFPGHHRLRDYAPGVLGSGTVSCDLAWTSRNLDDPAAHDDYTWIMSFYVARDGVIHALASNEFHGHRREGLCRFGKSSRGCWYNAITAVRSDDGGRSFRRPPGDHHVLGTVPYRFGERRRDWRSGLFAPTNIVEHGGYYHVAVFAEAQGAQRRGVCLLRTATPEDFRSWRAWDGHGFGIRLIDPYREPDADPGRHACVPVSPGTIGHQFNSVVRHRPSGRFVALMTASRPDGADGRRKAGIYAAHSPDLIAWSEPLLVLPAPILWHRDCDQPAALAYPSLIDPDSPSRHFDDVGERAWLYFTRMNLEPGCRVGWNRDLVRLAVTVRFDDGSLRITPAATHHGRRPGGVPVDTPTSAPRNASGA